MWGGNHNNNYNSGSYGGTYSSGPSNGNYGSSQSRGNYGSGSGGNHGSSYNSHQYSSQGSSWGGSAGGGASRQTHSQQPITKNFYREHPLTVNRSTHEIEAFKQSKEITTRGHNVPKPFLTFEEAGFPQHILSDLLKAGFPSPSPIQSVGWPIALSGQDMIGVSATGSGKTLAFLLPSIVHMSSQPPVVRGDGPVVLVMAPTRELAVQIQGEVSKFGRSSGVRCTCVYGGMPRGQQARELRDGVQIVIATPGRLIDFMESGTCSMSRVTFLVLDEADRMLDMGFEPQIRKIVAKIRPDRQTLLYSATWPKEVQKLARDLCNSEPAFVQIGNGELKAADTIQQHVEVIGQWDKMNRLFQLMEQINGQKCLIFTETKKGADELSYNLNRKGCQTSAIHGDKEQRERDYILRNFTSGRTTTLIATDVASRGLHIDDIQVVINFDFPVQVEDYVHRIGRTGRAGRHGVAYTFFTEKSARYAGDLVRILEQSKQQVPPQLHSMVGMGGRGGRSRYATGGAVRKFGKSNYGPPRGQGGGKGFGGGRKW